MTVTTFKDLPLAPHERGARDSAAAARRVRAWADAEDHPTQKFRRAHLWYDAENAEEFGGYKLPFADVIDGKLKAVSRGIMSAAGAIDGARGGVDIPKKEVPRVKSHLRKYYEKMGDTPPWDSTS